MTSVKGEMLSIDSCQALTFSALKWWEISWVWLKFCCAPWTHGVGVMLPCSSAFAFSFWLEFLPGWLQMSTGAFFLDKKHTALKIPTYTWRMSKPPWVLSTWKHILRNSSLQSKLRNKMSLSSLSSDFPVKTQCFTDPLGQLELPRGFVLSAPLAQLRKILQQVGHRQAQGFQISFIPSDPTCLVAL